ncbi:MAG TPA: VWA domain-containing protein, partial [Firmicutes bacterium]|nr:VWA domain-containing protein [Bacillota bacterium]
MLRIISIALLFFMYLNPISRKEERIIHPSNLIFLVDTSLSMSLKDLNRNDSRLDLALDFIKTNRFISVAAKDNYAFHYFAFDEDLHPVKEKDLRKLTAQGKWTGIFNALKRVRNDGLIFDISGILLFTDGVENLSPEISEEISGFSNFNIPVIAYGIGDFYHDRDAALVSAYIPEIFYRGESTEIAVEAEFRNLNGEELKFEYLLNDEKILESIYEPDSGHVNRR